MPGQIDDHCDTDTDGETIGSDDSPRSSDESWHSTDAEILSDTEDFPHWMHSDSEWTPED
jgi:hypothetical protein